MPGAVASWRHVARALGTRLEVGHPDADAAYLRIPAVVDGAPLSACLTGVHDGDPLLDGRYVRTRIDASAPGSDGLTVRVEVCASVLARLFGRRTEGVGDRAFDDRYAVRTRDVGFARAWLGDHARARLAACNGGSQRDPYQLALTRGALALSRAGAERDPERLIRALRAGAALALRGRALLDGWTRLAAHLHGRAIAPAGVWSAGGDARIELDAGAAIDSALVSVRGWRARRLFTRVTCRASRVTERAVERDRAAGAERVEWALVSERLPDAERPALPRACAAVPAASGVPAVAGFGLRVARGAAAPGLGEPVRVALAAARPAAVLASAARVAVLYAGHVVDPARLEPALALARALAAASVVPAGPYR